MSRILKLEDVLKCAGKLRASYSHPPQGPAGLRTGDALTQGRACERYTKRRRLAIAFEGTKGAEQLLSNIRTA
jgi:hypothetical protein